MAQCTVWEWHQPHSPFCQSIQEWIFLYIVRLQLVCSFLINVNCRSFWVSTRSEGTRDNIDLVQDIVLLQFSYFYTCPYPISDCECCDDHLLNHYSECTCCNYSFSTNKCQMMALALRLEPTIALSCSERQNRLLGGVTQLADDSI